MCFTPPFDVKCKTLLGLAKSRIKFLKNKREAQVKQMKQELANLLKAKQEPSAHIKVEQIYREQKIMAAYEILDLFCELIVTRLPIIKAQKQCPIDLREAVASIIYASPDIPELKKIGGMLSAKYGKEFTLAAAELRQDNGVNRVVIEKLSVSGPSIEVKLTLMKDIAVEHGLDWDPTDLESQILTRQEDLLKGPSQFVTARQMSLRSSPSNSEHIVQQNVSVAAREPTAQSSAFLGERKFIPFVQSTREFESTLSGSQSSTQGLTPRRQGSSGSAAHVLLATSAHYEEKVRQFVPFVQPALEVDKNALSRSGSLQSHGSSGHASRVSLTSSYQFEGDEDAQAERRKMLQHVISTTHKAAESAIHAAAVAREAVKIAAQNSMMESRADNESDSDGSEAPQWRAKRESSCAEPQYNLCFDEAEEQRNLYNRKQDSWKYPMYHRGPIEGHSASQSRCSRGKYKDDGHSDSVWHSTSMPNRHEDNPVSSQGLNNGYFLSVTLGDEHSNMRSLKGSSLDKSKTSPISDPFEWDDLNSKHADGVAPFFPEGSPMRAPPRLQGAQTPCLTKTTSFTHPKLPDCDHVFAHFQALKAMKAKK